MTIYSFNYYMKTNSACQDPFIFYYMKKNGDKKGLKSTRICYKVV